MSMSRIRMMKFLFIWMLCWHLVKNTDVIMNAFRVSAQRGDIPDITIACASECSQEDTCVGFDVSANECTLLNLPNAAPEPGHTLYLSQDRIDENFPPCTPSAARRSQSTQFYVFFSGEDEVYRYFADDVDDMQDGDYFSVHFISKLYPQLAGSTANAMYRYKQDTYVIIDTSMAVFKRNHAAKVYELYTPHYPRSLEDEMGDVPLPSSVNAADVNDTTLYLIQGNTVYSYSMDGYAPDIVYEFLGQFDMRANSALNPFSAGPGSLLDHPASWITAMAFTDNHNVLVAFSYKDIYLYSAGNWEYIGVVATPCD